jgi:hypothetical protein
MMISTSINAALVDRGGGLIYDSDFDVTWKQDAYAAGGLMSREDAITWVDNLNFAGFDDWRLPSTLNVDPSCGTDDTSKLYLTLTPCSGGEMGHLIYTEGLTYQPGDATLPGLSFGSLGLFDNVYGGGYWTSTDYLWTGQPYEDPAGSTSDSTGKPYPRTPKDNFGWLFYFGGSPGQHKTILATTNTRAVWAVRDGDVLSAVPLPAAVWLFGSGLLGLAGLAGCKGGRG